MAAEKPRVGWIGTGVMGQAMCGHILSAGFPVTVFNRTLSKAHTLCDKGTIIADNPKSVAAESDIVFTIVGYPKDVREVIIGENGVLQGLKPGGTVDDMTTSEPSLARVEKHRVQAGQGKGAIERHTVQAGHVKGAVEKHAAQAGQVKGALERQSVQTGQIKATVEKRTVETGRGKSVGEKHTVELLGMRFSGPWKSHGESLTSNSFVLENDHPRVLKLRRLDLEPELFDEMSERNETSWKASFQI